MPPKTGDLFIDNEYVKLPRGVATLLLRTEFSYCGFMGERRVANRMFTLLVMVFLTVFPTLGATEVQSISIAFGDNPDTDKAALDLVAARLAKRGIELKATYLQSEDIAAQSVLSGQSDIGVGAPYALIQKHDIPVRMFFQLGRLRFFPVVNTEHYKNWSDLDGADVYVHGAGSGTEAIMLTMAREKGITYGSVNYLPGSGVRAQALIRRRIFATIVDASRMRFLEERVEGPFAALPTPDTNVSDDILFASQEFLRKNPKTLGVLLDELLTVWRGINRDPEYIIAGMQEYGLLDDVPPEKIEEIREFYRDSVHLEMFSNIGGLDEVQDDLEFFKVAKGGPASSAEEEIEDFWDFEPLRASMARIAKQ